jgi:cytoskeletal protein RodZ
VSADRDDDDDPSWHNQKGIVFAAGAAGLVLAGLLVWAVIHSSRGSVPSDSIPPETSSSGSSVYTTSSTSSTSYSVPTVQTSEDDTDTGAPVSSTPGQPGDAATTAQSGETTTTTNPYGTTTPTNAGHI